MATQNTAMDNAALIKEVNEAHKHKKYSVGYHAQTVVAVIVTLIMLFPLYWMIATSFKSAEEVQLVIPTLFPHEFHPENYLNVLQKANFMKYYWNTIVMTAGILLLQVGTGVLAAYGFAVGRFKGRNALFYVVLGALMIPLQVTFIPIYIMCANWDLCDTFLGLILPEAVSRTPSHCLHPPGRTQPQRQYPCAYRYQFSADRGSSVPALHGQTGRHPHRVQTPLHRRGDGILQSRSHGAVPPGKSLSNRPFAWQQKPHYRA